MTKINLFLFLKVLVLVLVDEKNTGGGILTISNRSVCSFTVLHHLMHITSIDSIANSDNILITCVS